MNHRRGAAVLIGGIALLVLIGDGIYVALRSSLGHGFGIGFLVGSVALPLYGLVARALGAGAPIGRDRRRARARARRANVLYAAFVLALVVGARSLGDDALLGVLLGALAGLGCLFFTMSVRELISRR